MAASKKNQSQTEEHKPENPQTENLPPETQASEEPLKTEESAEPQNAENNGGEESLKEQPDDKKPGDKNEEKTEPEENPATAKKTVRMVLRHKSHTPRYHRCGLTLTQVFAEYDVPEECVAKIKADKWIAVKDGK